MVNPSPFKPGRRKDEVNRMECPRCKVETIRINYPVTHCTGPTGKRLARTIDRCPVCGLEWRDQPVTIPKDQIQITGKQGQGKVLIVIEPEAEQLTMFEAVVGGF